MYKNNFSVEIKPKKCFFSKKIVPLLKILKTIGDLLD